MIDWKSEWKPLAAIIGLFTAFYFLPVGSDRFRGAVIESLVLARWYAREHVVLCLVPALFIAGAISVFVSQASVIRYLGAGANKVLAYGVASVSGSILAVCSCTVLPLFAGIYRMGAGLGPATTFLYSGPAINVLAVILTARVLGVEFGVARAAGAVFFGVAIGLLMALIFRREEAEKASEAMSLPEERQARPLWRTAVYFATMVGLLVFANWGKPEAEAGLWYTIYSVKWIVTALFAAGLGVTLVLWFGVAWWKVVAAAIAPAILAAFLPEFPIIAFGAGAVGLSVVTAGGGEDSEAGEWFGASWGFAKQILPLLLGGVLMAGLLMGRTESATGDGGLIPRDWVEGLVGGNSLRANLFASVAGALMYFATLTEVPILKGFLVKGMGNGPALALLLAGPALSLPNILVIRSVMGTKKTAVFVGLVVVMATASGVIFGRLFPETFAA